MALSVRVAGELGDPLAQLARAHSPLISGAVALQRWQAAVVPPRLMSHGPQITPPSTRRCATRRCPQSTQIGARRTAVQLGHTGSALVAW